MAWCVSGLQSCINNVGYGGATMQVAQHVSYLCNGIAHHSSQILKVQRKSSCAIAVTSVPNIRGHGETQVIETELNRAACPVVKPEIDQSAFSTVDLRVGLITEAKTVLDLEISAKRGKPTDSRRYLQLTVDIGCESRTVVSECRYVMDVEDAVGKKVLVVANVRPTEILGIRSHGLVLTGFNYDPTPMPRSFKVILPGLGRLPPGSQIMEAAVPK